MNQEFKKPELLSPAGDMECLKAAVAFGADAVYMAGQSFGMRAASANFTEDELRSAIDYCHNNGVKVYITCNTLPRNDELAALPNFLRQCEAAKADALIIADLGVLALAREHAPSLDLHISTQTGVVNYLGANALYDLGAKRVVLARELSLSEIRGVRKNTPAGLEIEAFVHGAMCMSFSGRCLLSNYMTNRDANRGECSQPCRWEYYVTEKQRPDEHFKLEPTDSGTFIFNSRDMCLIEHIPALVNAGVSSLKIEGRAKSAYYVASTTSAYRRAIDFFAEHPEEKLPKGILDEVGKISHREYSTGFYFGNEPGQTVENGGYIREYTVVAVCEGENLNMIKLKQRNKFLKGDVADVLPPKGKPFEVKLDEIYDEYMNPIDAAPHAEMTVYLKTDAQIPAGSYLRVKL